MHGCAILGLPASCDADVEMSDQNLLSPETLSVLFRRLDALIEEARTLQQQITARLVAARRRDQPDRSGQPERRRNTRKKNN